MYFTEENVSKAKQVLAIQPNNFVDGSSTGATVMFLNNELHVEIDVRSLSYFLKDIDIERFSTSEVYSKLDQWAQVVRKLGTKEILQSDFIWGLCQAATTNSVEPLLYGDINALAINALFTQNLPTLSLLRFHESTLVRVSAALNEFPKNLLLK